MRRFDRRDHSKRPTPFSWHAPQARAWICSSPMTNDSRAGKLTASSSSWPWVECLSDLILARLLRRQIAGLPDSIQIQPAGRKFRDLPAACCGKRYVKDSGSHQSANGALIHGKGAVGHPVPAFVVVNIVNSDHNLPLELSVPTWWAVRKT